MNKQQGFALITVLIMLVVFTALVTAYFTLTGIELSTTASSAASNSGFYASEGGLNMRGEAIRQTFLDYNRPKGTALDPDTACPSGGGATASDDFACQTVSLGGRNVTTYVIEKPENNSPNENDRMIRIAGGETFSGLNAIQYRYDVFSDARSPRDDTLEARTIMTFRSRLVPVFQFAAFYNKDLEILPGADMTLNGRVHVNGDLYTNANNTLSITGKITAAKRDNGRGGDFYRRRKNNNSCGGTVRVDDADESTQQNPAVECSGRIPQSTLDGWNGQIQTGLDTLTVPEVEAFNIGGQYWNQADLRIALDLTQTPPAIIVPNKNIIAGNITADNSMTNRLTSNSCKATSGSTRSYTDMSGSSGSNIRAVEWSNSFRDNREGMQINMLEVDIQALLECMHKHKNQLFSESSSSERDINDTSQGGLVVYMTVIGADSSNLNNYGVRVRNGDQLRSAKPGDPAIKGLTLVTDQAMYVQGDYNRDDRATDTWKPASFLADSLNILSNAWTNDAVSSQGIGNRVANNTRVNAAFLAGTDSTGNQEGVGGQGGAYNGGLENYPRLHENWNGRTLTYQGSFVSFDRPQHVDGAWGQSGVYEAPNRAWSYDERFNSAENLPPLAPRFVYLQQERFVRDFEQ